MYLDLLLKKYSKKALLILFVSVGLTINYNKLLACNKIANEVVDTTDQEVIVDVTKIISTGFAGFGTQYNQNVYSKFSETCGIAPSNIGQLEARVKELKSSYVRIFFDSKAWTNDPQYSGNTADFLASFIKTVKLAQDAGAETINITYWHSSTAEKMPDFADVLRNLIVNYGYTSVKEVTIQNEPNSTRIKLDDYKACYSALDLALKKLGIRNHIRFVGGDLVQTNQHDWFSYMAANMSDLLSGYSSHIYWDEIDTLKPINRLTSIARIVDSLGVSKKPVYITEYGVRGGNKTNGSDPGYLTGTTIPVSQTNVSALQNALFQINGLNLGFSGFIRWDCYKAKYDNGDQYYSCIGSGADGFPLYPLYYMTWLFTHTSEPGWQVVSSSPVTTDNKPIVVAAMTSSDASGQTIYIINKSITPVTYKVHGLIPNKNYTVCYFNNNGKGKLQKVYIKTDSKGTVFNTIEKNSLVAITTFKLRLP